MHSLHANGLLGLWVTGLFCLSRKSKSSVKPSPEQIRRSERETMTLQEGQDAIGALGSARHVEQIRGQFFVWVHPLGEQDCIFSNLDPTHERSGQDMTSQFTLSHLMS